MKRVCNIQIQRIPSADNQNFNSQVVWKTVVDTTWNTYTRDVIVGYGTPYVQRTRKVLAEPPTLDEITLMNHKETVHSTVTLNNYPYRNVVTFQMPTFYDTDYESKRVVSWTYRLL